MTFLFVLYLLWNIFICFILLWNIFIYSRIISFLIKIILFGNILFYSWTIFYFFDRMDLIVFLPVEHFYLFLQ